MSSCRAFISVLIACSLALSASAVPQPADRPDSLEWNFDVYLGDKKVGYHKFRLEEDDASLRLTSEADFRVKLLFVTLYKYRHENSETWNAGCLQRIESRTNANGKEFSVRGIKRPDRFEVETKDARNELSGCVKTFAYWNPDFLQASVLMNPQTGEVLPVSIDRVAIERVSVRGEQVEAQRYRLKASGMDLDLWYSKGREWLGLQSTTKDGRKIRYELT